MLRQLLKWLLLASFVFFGVALWQRDALPPPSELLPALQDEPQQRPIQKRAFEATVGDITYTVQPLYSYDIVGLVVSRHDNGGWRDYIHRDWNDKLNVADICVIWGDNARSGAYNSMSFWNGQFTCNWEGSSDAADRFDMFSISNNHVLTANAAIAKRILSARIGDQIHMRGNLSEYSHNHGFAFHRGTSTVRTDTGNGACETLYVEDFEIIKPSPNPWRKLVWVAGAMLVLSLLAWFFQPVRFDQ